MRRQKSQGRWGAEPSLSERLAVFLLLAQTLTMAGKIPEATKVQQSYCILATCCLDTVTDEMLIHQPACHDASCAMDFCTKACMTPTIVELQQVDDAVAV